MSLQYGHSPGWRAQEENQEILLYDSGDGDFPPCGQKQMGCGGGLVMPRIAQMALAEQNTVGSHCLGPVAFTVEERCGIEKSKLRPQLENPPRPNSHCHLTKT